MWPRAEHWRGAFTDQFPLLKVTAIVSFLYVLVIVLAPLQSVFDERMYPASDWLVVSEIHVEDAREGDDPVMRVKRSIQKAFEGAWHVEIKRKLESGRYAVACYQGGSNFYAPDNQLPEPLTLSWWTYPHRCELGPGTYRVETRWLIFISRTDRTQTRLVRSVSNDFQIRAR